MAQYHFTLDFFYVANTILCLQKGLHDIHSLHKRSGLERKDQGKP